MAFGQVSAAVPVQHDILLPDASDEELQLPEVLRPWITGQRAARATGALGLLSLCVAGAIAVANKQAVVESAAAAARDLGVGVGYTCTSFNDGDTRVEQCNPACFPGDASVQVQGRSGTTPMKDLREGDLVLAQQAGGHFEFQPVLGFLHVDPQGPAKLNSVVAVQHARGEFRATANHMVFVVGGDGSIRSEVTGALKVGDRLAMMGGRNSVVIAIEQQQTGAGMYAPLTDSGTIVVDDVLASSYAVHGPGLRWPHSLTHSAFFLARLYHRARSMLLSAGGASLSAVAARGVSQEEYTHPFVQLLYRFQIDRLAKVLF